MYEFLGGIYNPIQPQTYENAKTKSVNTNMP